MCFYFHLYCFSSCNTADVKAADVKFTHHLNLHAFAVTFKLGINLDPHPSITKQKISISICRRTQ